MKTQSQQPTKSTVKLTFPICNVHFHRVFTVTIFATWHFTRCFCNRSYRVMFFDFLIPLSAKTPSFESISGRPSSKKALKTRCFRWEGYEKVKQTLHNSEVWAIFAVKTHITCAIWNSSGAIPVSPAKWSQEPLVGGPLPTRHGQDDGSLTNSLKLTFGCVDSQRQTHNKTL